MLNKKTYGLTTIELIFVLFMCGVVVSLILPNILKEHYLHYRFDSKTKQYYKNYEVTHCNLNKEVFQSKDYSILSRCVTLLNDKIYCLGDNETLREIE